MKPFFQNPKHLGAFAIMASLMCGFSAIAYQDSAGRAKKVNPAQKENPGEKAPVSANEKELRDAGQAFAEAFNRGDAKALAEQWTEAGEYSNENGVFLKGRPAIQKAYESWLATHTKPTIKVKIDKVRVLSKDAVWVEGALEFQGHPDGPPEHSRFKTLRVREDGKWLIAESLEIGASESSLGELAWLLGEWKASTADVDVALVVTPWLGKGFFKADFKIRRKGEPEMEGFQVIGKDPRTGGLRSWIFETQGGSGDGKWVYDGHKWDLEIQGYLASGVPYNSVQIFSPLGKDAFLWQSIERFAGGYNLPDTHPLKLQRAN